jgi:hypothetical protein
MSVTRPSKEALKRCRHALFVTIIEGRLVVARN